MNTIEEHIRQIVADEMLKVMDFMEVKVVQILEERVKLKVLPEETDG